MELSCLSMLMSSIILDLGQFLIQSWLYSCWNSRSRLNSSPRCPPDGQRQLIYFWIIFSSFLKVLSICDLQDLTGNMCWILTVNRHLTFLFYLILTQPLQETSVLIALVSETKERKPARCPGHRATAQGPARAGPAGGEARSSQLTEREALRGTGNPEVGARRGEGG